MRNFDSKIDLQPAIIHKILRDWCRKSRIVDFYCKVWCLVLLNFLTLLRNFYFSEERLGTMSALNFEVSLKFPYFLRSNKVPIILWVVVVNYYIHTNNVRIAVLVTFVQFQQRNSNRHYWLNFVALLDNLSKSHKLFWSCSPSVPILW